MDKAKCIIIVYAKKYHESLGGSRISRHYRNTPQERDGKKKQNPASFEMITPCAYLAPDH